MSLSATVDGQHRQNVASSPLLLSPDPMEPSCAASSFFSCCSAALRFTPNRGLSAACSTTRCRGRGRGTTGKRGQGARSALSGQACAGGTGRREDVDRHRRHPAQERARPHQVTTSDGRTLSFTVGTKHYREQHIKLKNSRQVNPLAEDMTRINRELAEQTRAYQTFSPAQPSNLLFDKPVQGPLSSPFGLRRFFNGEERNPTPASTSRSEPALPSRHQPLARSSSSATTSSTAIRCSSTTARASSACSVTCRRWT